MCPVSHLNVPDASNFALGKPNELLSALSSDIPAHLKNSLHKAAITCFYH